MSRFLRLRRRLRRTTALPPPERLDERNDLRGYVIGRFSWGHLTVSSRNPTAHLTIGQFCSFAHGCQIILGGEHRTDFVSTYRFPAYAPFKERYAHLAGNTSTTKGDVVIGNDVWIGNQSLILSGVHIGDGAVIGAGSVVRKSIPPYALVAGNPARVARLRFPEHQIEALLRIRWWDWPLDQITDSIEALMSTDLQRFIEAFDPGPA